MIRLFYHWGLALIQTIRFGFPSEKLIVIGVTGTNGKTTVVTLLHEVLIRAGFRVGSVSSLRFKINDEERKNTLKMTMPGRGALQKFLAECVREKCRYAILEVTSEGVRQFRHLFINFDCVAVTNVTPEHIESHGSFEAYRRSKVRFFSETARGRRKMILGGRIQKTLVVNLDDAEYRHFLISSADRRIGTTLRGAHDAACHTIIPASDISISDKGIRFAVGDVHIISRLRGGFNVQNICTVLAIGEALGIPLPGIAESIRETAGVAGRLEKIETGRGFSVFVDYAHTPDALEKVYGTLSDGGSPLICVLGAAGGGRDRWKRPEFGKLASRFCREIILTNEDPYDEDPEAILTDIESGFSQIQNPKTKIRKIIDRRGAIREALARARTGDVVIITGKGAEPWMMGPRGSRIPWDDREVVREELGGIQNH